MPNFVGMTMRQIDLLSQQISVPTVEFSPGGPDDLAGIPLQVLMQSFTDENGRVFHAHTPDQIVATILIQPPGSVLTAGTAVGLCFELALGVPQ